MLCVKFARACLQIRLSNILPCYTSSCRSSCYSSFWSNKDNRKHEKTINDTHFPTIYLSERRATFSSSAFVSPHGKVKYISNRRRSILDHVSPVTRQTFQLFSKQEPPSNKEDYQTASLQEKSESPPREDDDLKAILKDKSLSITTKFKIIFQQYGVVMAVVHIATSIVWIALFYTAVSRGLDILPWLESWGVFEHLEKWGFSYAEKLKTSGASNYVMTYLIYEIAKPVRYIVTLFGTTYCVRYLRRKGFFARPPPAASMGSLVQTQSKIVGNRIRRTTKKYGDEYKSRVSRVKRKRRSNSGNGHSN